MRQLFYFGKDTSFAIKPHWADSKNAAIQIKHVTPRAAGPVHVELFLSNLDPCFKGKAQVKFYCADPTQQAEWFVPGNLVKKWDLEFSGENRCPKEAPVENCIWHDEVEWDPHHHEKSGLKHDDYYALLAVVICEQTGQTPTEENPATDPTVAVFNSLAVPSHDGRRH